VACPLDVLKENVEEMSEDVEQRSIQSDSAYESTDDLRNMDEHVNVSNQQSFVKQEQDDPRIHADTVMSYMQSTAYMYVAPLPPDVLNSTLQAIKSRSNDGVDEEVFLVERTFLEKCSCIATQLDDRDAPEDDWDTQEDNVDHLHLKNGLAENLNVAYVRKVLGDWTRKQFKYLPRIM
jgi:hypothetical protein